MDIGDFRVEQLSEGVFHISPEGTIEKIGFNPGESHQEEILPEKVQKAGLDPVLIDTGRTCVLLDAGLGMGLDKNETNLKTSNIINNLEIFNYRPSDVKYVILSHLHYDHVAGLSYTDQAGRIAATLPDALIYIQKREWDAALKSIQSASEAGNREYELDDLYRLVSDGRFVFLDKDHEKIIDGVTVIRTGGHTPGHQITRLRSRGETAFYCGDLIPNEQHVNHYIIHKEDADPIRARKVKMLLIQQAFREQATLFFYHSVYKKAGKISLDKDRKFVLRQTP